MIVPVLATFFIGILKYEWFLAILYVIGQKYDYRAIFYCNLYGMVLSVLIIR